MNLKLKLIGLWTLVLTMGCLQLPGTVRAADSTCLKQEQALTLDHTRPALIIELLYKSGCLGQEKDDLDLARQLPAELPDDVTAEERRARTLRVLDELLIRAGTQDPAGVKKSLEPLVRQMSAAQQLLLDKAESEDLKPGKWSYVEDDGMFPNLGISLDPYLADPACKLPDDPQCVEAFADAKQLVTFGVLVGRTMSYYNHPRIAAAYSYVETLDKQWESYFTEARSQFPWELLFNGWLYGRQIEGKDGLQVPPEHQWILLHPSPALEYVDAAADGNRFEPAVVIELAGYNRWRWDGARMKQPWGVSAVASLSDRAGTDNWGYGGVVHYDNTFSLGVTTRDGDVGIFVSADVGDWISKYSDKTKQAYQRGRSIWDAIF